MSGLDVDAMVAELRGWVGIESPTSDTPGVNRMIDAVAAAVAGLPIGVQRHAGRNGLGDTLELSAGPRTGAPGILLLSHVDTVHPLGTLASDLPMRIEGDRFYGPGIYDMKGGAFLALAAVRRAVTANALTRSVTFLFTPDEEIGSPTSRDIIEAKARTASHVLVTEPARDGGKVVTGRKGVARFDVHVEGRPSHAGSRHPDGRSAIREAAHQILVIEALTDYARQVTTTVGQVSGGTAANVIPQHARFAVDLRVATLEDGEDLCARIRGLQPVGPDMRITVTGGMNRPPYAKTPAVAALFDTARALATPLGIDLHDVELTGGGSDGNFTAALGIPTLDGLGIDGDGAHTLQEHALVSSLAPRSQLIEALIRAI
jgi:glutamate carboxypeptidase